MDMLSRCCNVAVFGGVGGDLEFGIYGQISILVLPFWDLGKMFAQRPYG